MCLHIIHISDNMPNMTLSVPKELYNKMKKHTELKWSEVARQAFEKKIKETEITKKLLSKSELTEKDVERIGHKIKGRIRGRFSY